MVYPVMVALRDFTHMQFTNTKFDWINKDKDKVTHEPGKGHKDVLELLQWFRVFADGSCRFGRKVETLYVGVAVAAEHKDVAPNAFRGI